jgi:trans-aconitate methyltransferase
MMSFNLVNYANNNKLGIKIDKNSDKKPYNSLNALVKKYTDNKDSNIQFIPEIKPFNDFGKKILPISKYDTEVMELEHKLNILRAEYKNKLVPIDTYVHNTGPHNIVSYYGYQLLDEEDSYEYHSQYVSKYPQYDFKKKYKQV